jgi:hypothetical protein
MFGVTALAQDFGPASGKIGVIGGRDEKVLFPGPGMPGGGQTEIRMVQSIYTSDPDELDVAQRLRPYDIESWLAEWSRVAEKNERLAEGYAAAGLKVTAHEHYRRAQEFWSNATLYLSEHHPRQLPTYKKMREMFDKAWELNRPPFERVKITVDGKTLEGYFRKPGGAAGKRFPTMIAFQGADTMAENTIMGGAGSYVARGMAYLAVDLPGQGSALRLQGSVLTARSGAYREGACRLSRDPPRRGRRTDRHAGHQHGRVGCPVLGQRREANQDRRDVERLLRPRLGPVRLLPADPGSCPLDYRSPRSG